MPGIVQQHSVWCPLLQVLPTLWDADRVSFLAASVLVTYPALQQETWGHLAFTTATVATCHVAAQHSVADTLHCGCCFCCRPASWCCSSATSAAEVAWACVCKVQHCSLRAAPCMTAQRMEWQCTERWKVRRCFRRNALLTPPPHTHTVKSAKACHPHEKVWLVRLCLTNIPGLGCIPCMA